MELYNYLIRHQELVWDVTLDHIEITLFTMFIAISVGILTGILIAKAAQLARPVMMGINVIQTIPALAMFGLLMPIVGIGSKAGIVALTLYAILPIVKNTYAGISGVDGALLEAGRAMGMTGVQLLFRVQLPLAAPMMMAGIRTSSVIAVGMATLIALIGGSGLGKIIFRGITRVDNTEIMVGAMLAALLAIMTDLLLSKVENRLRWDANKGGGN